MKLIVFTSDAAKSSEQEFKLPTFEGSKGLQAVKEVVVAHRANARQGTRSTKTRGEVRGGGKKPWNQKGTGRARSGMASSPIWRGGGRAFPNSPDENYSHKVNRKMYRAGMRSILSELVRQDRLAVVDEFSVDAPKTKLFAEKIKSMNVGESVMVVTDSFDENLYLSSRNLPHVLVVEAQYADPVSLVHFPKIIVTKNAVKKLEEMLA